MPLHPRSAQHRSRALQRSATARASVDGGAGLPIGGGVAVQSARVGRTVSAPSSQRRGRMSGRASRRASSHRADLVSAEELGLASVSGDLDTIVASVSSGTVGGGSVSARSARLASRRRSTAVMGGPASSRVRVSARASARQRAGSDGASVSDPVLAKRSLAARRGSELIKSARESQSAAALNISDLVGDLSD